MSVCLSPGSRPVGRAACYCLLPFDAARLVKLVFSREIISHLGDDRGAGALLAGENTHTRKSFAPSGFLRDNAAAFIMIYAIKRSRRNEALRYANKDKQYLKTGTAFESFRTNPA